jgi:hypothetical protein
MWGVEHWTCPGEWGRDKEVISHCWTVRGVARNQAFSTELSVTYYKAAKAEGGNRLNCLEEPSAPRRYRERHKGCKSRATNSQSRAGGRSQNWSLEQRAAFKTELPHLAKGGAEQTELQLKNNTVVTCWKQSCPPCMSWQSYLTSQLQLILWTKGLSTTHKPVTWWDIRTSA